MCGVVWKGSGGGMGAPDGDYSGNIQGLHVKKQILRLR